MTWDDLHKKATLRLLQLHYDAKCGHLGSNLSCLDIMLYLYHYQMKPDDVFIMSKGHSAGALYIALWTKGIITDQQLQTFHKNGTMLCCHASSEYNTFSTGSLGHGLSLAVGMALADQIAGRNRKIYCLMSDGELQEGSVHEALRFAPKCENLIGIIDNNELVGFDRVANHGGSDGHAFSELEKEFTFNFWLKIFHTVKGRGTCYSGMMESHYLPLNEVQYQEACANA